MKIGLYFGTFNPIHVGHLIIANYIQQHSVLDKVWLVVTPHNPFKSKKTLLDNYQRLEMVYLATKDYTNLQPSNIEFNLKQPTYTIDTLTYFTEKYPNHEFSLIMGEDNLKSLHKWKNYEQILNRYHIFVYPRLTETQIAEQLKNHPNITKVNAPIMQLSSTAIRKQIKADHNVRPMLPENVWQYLDEMNFYKK